MPTVVTRYVHTGSTAGGDGTTNATAGANRAWPTLDHARGELNTAYSSNLVTADVQVELVCEGTTDDTTAVTDTWPTSDATRYIHIQVPTGNRKVAFDTNVYTLARNGNFASALTITTNTIKLTGIQVYHTGNLDVGGNHGLTLACSGSGGSIVCDGVKSFKSANAGQVAFVISNTAGTYVFRNCVAGGSTFRFRGLLAMSAGPSDTYVYCYNNTGQFAGTATGISLVFTAGGSNKVVRLKNNLLQTATTGIVVTNATTDDQVTNYSATTTDASFVDATNGDFNLSASDTIATNLGTDLSAVADYPFSMDGNLVTRTGTWDLGADDNAITRQLIATQLLAEVAVTPSVALRVTQLVAEALVTDTAVADLRASQLVAEVFHAADPALRASQLLAEILATPTVALRASQLLAEILILPDVQLRASQLVAEVLVTPNVLTVTHTGLLFPRGSVPPF